MQRSEFIYVTYIRTTPEKLWEALTNPKFHRQFFYGTTHDCEWKKGSPWRLMIPDGRVADSGEVLDVDPSKLLVLKWRNEFKPELREEGYSRATFEIEPMGSSVKLTVTHVMDKEGSKFIEGVSEGWPSILASLKSLLETGESLEETRQWPEGV